jgi:hypothetical protein
MPPFTSISLTGPPALWFSGLDCGICGNMHVCRLLVHQIARAITRQPIAGAGHWQRP